MIRQSRGQVCDTVLYSLSILGLIAYIPSVILSIAAQLYHIAIFDTIVYATIILLTFNKWIPQFIKALIASAAFYLLGTFLFLYLGPVGAGNLWLLGFSLVAGLTLGRRASIVSLIINTVTQIVFYVLIKGNLMLNGEIFDGEAHAWLIRAVNFFVINAIIVITNVILSRKLIETFTLHRESEEKRALLQEQLIQSQKLEALGQLTSGIAHDFNNILTAIISSAQVLQLPKRNIGDGNRKLVDMIYQSGIRAADLISKMTNFVRISPSTFRILDLHKAIDDSVAFLSQTINKNIEITIRNKAVKHFVKGNHSELQNVFVNLVINATHSMTGGGHLSISTENVSMDVTECDLSPFDIHPGEFIKIEIRDTGTGISRENLGKIFDPFFTTKKVGEGSGLGLTTSYGIIKGHFGVISASSEENKGSIFHLCLPCCEPSETEEDDQYRTVQGCKGTILLIDDEDIVRVSCSSILEDAGYTVLAAENGAKGIEIFEKNSKEIDLVLLDMIMPGLSGKDVFSKLRKQNRVCPVIVCSGFASHEDLDEMMASGLNGFVKKPYSGDTLFREINKVINKE